MGYEQPCDVPHSVQQPQAPARMTLLEPQFEQVMSIYMLPSAVCTRSAWVLTLWLMCGSPSLPFLWLITSMMPGVPTVAESGYPGFEATNWYAFVAPGKTPKKVAASLVYATVTGQRETRLLKVRLRVTGKATVTVKLVGKRAANLGSTVFSSPGGTRTFEQPVRPGVATPGDEVRTATATVERTQQLNERTGSKQRLEAGRDFVQLTGHAGTPNNAS